MVEFLANNNERCRKIAPENETQIQAGRMWSFSPVAKMLFLLRNMSETFLENGKRLLDVI